MMPSKKQYIKKEYLKKFDNFIQDALNKYYIVDPWDELYSNTDKNSYSVISNKSIIPDLVIFNKTFNKNDCFLNSNKSNKYNKFPRVKFIFKPKKINNYIPSLNTTTTENNENNTDNQKMLEPFEFKSIPKEIEDKYIHNDTKNISNNNNILNELKDFFQNDNHKSDVEIKINVLKEDEKKESDKKIEQKVDKNIPINDNENKIQKRKYSYNDNYHKNKFEIPMNINKMPINYNNNLNYINYIRNLNYQKMMQNIQFQNHVNKVLGNVNNINNNNQKNKFNYSPIEKKNENEKKLNDGRTVNNNNILDLNNEISNNDNQNKSNDNVNPISYYKTTDENDIIEKYINNIDLIYNKNKIKRDWKVVDNRNNFIVYKFNNEQLFYFLIF